MPLRPRSLGATTLSSGKDVAGTRDLLFVAGGETAEFIEPRLQGQLPEGVELESNDSSTNAVATADDSCYLRGAFILGGGVSGYVSVFGPW
jgi:hypothetical protein